MGLCYVRTCIYMYVPLLRATISIGYLQEAEILKRFVFSKHNSYDPTISTCSCYSVLLVLLLQARDV